MANVRTFADPRVNMRAELLVKAGATGEGDWVLCEGFDKFSIHVVISNTATVQIMVSNEPTPAAAGGVKYGNDISASALAEIKIPVRWVRAKISAWSSGTVSAYMEAV